MPLPVATGDYPMYGHAADFSWLAGRIERSLACTYVRFGDHRRDQWDGHIALDASPEQLDELKNDDMIVIKGELVRLGDGVCGSPSFIVSTIEEH